MTDSRTQGVLGHLHRWLDAAATTTDDGRLLERFVREREEAAFAELVARHGPLVMGLCRRLLGNVQDAEDVFQATFFVLARKAATIRKPESLSSWLHGVAYRLALKTRTDAARRCCHERAVPVPEHAEADLSWSEVRGLIDEELQRLPEKQRMPLILCYLEGLTQDEAARRLGWPRGTLKRRLEAGRERLRLRLTRRGVTLGAGLFAVALTESGSRAAVPLALRNVTVRTSLQFLTHETATIAATPAALLAQRALQTMLITKCKLGAMLVLILSCAAVAAGLAISQAPPENKTEAAAPPRSAEDRQSPQDRYGDPLPAGALARMGTLRLRHSNMTADAVFTPDSKTVIVSDWGGEVVFWDVATGREVRRFQAVDGRVNGLALAITGDGKTLAAGGFGNFSLWDVATGKKLAQTAVPAGNIWQMLFTPDGKTLVLHDAKSILLWDVAGNKKLREIKGHKGYVMRLALSPDGKTLASVSEEDRHIRLWDVASGKQKSAIEAHEKDGINVAFSPDGKTLASAGSPYGGLCLWDAATGKKLRQLSGHPSMFAFFPDGKTMAGLQTDGRLYLYDVVRGKRLRQFDLLSGPWGLTSGDNQFMARLAIAPDGKTWAALGGGSYSLDMGDGVLGQLLHSFAGHRSRVMGLAFPVDGKTLISSAPHESVLAWDAAAGALRGRFKASGFLRRNFDEATGALRGLLAKEEVAYGEALALSPDGKLLAAAAGLDGLILWDAVSRKKVRPCMGPQEWIVSAVWSADGSTLVSNSQEAIIRVWDPATGKQRQAIEAPRQSLNNRIALSPDGAIVAACKRGRGTIFLWATDTGKESRRIETLHGDVTQLAFSPDGASLISGGSNGGICVWEPKTGKLLRSWATTPTATGCLVISREGRSIVSGHSDASVHLWELATGKERACFQGHRGGVRAVVISRDGRQIASGSEDTTILIWDATGGAHLDAALSPEQLQTLWGNLRDADAGRAYRAIWRMALTPKQSLPFLAERLPPAASLEAAPQKQVDRLLADLDSDRFAVRQNAEAELEKMGPRIEPALHKALEGKPSLEVRRRLEAIVERLTAKQTFERLQVRRALEAIEHMNTLEARQLVDSLANGAPHAWLTEEARAIHKRLTAEPASAPQR